MRTYFRILAYARPLGAYLPQFLILTALATIFSVVNFAILIPLLEILFNQVSNEVVPHPGSFSVSIDYFKDLFYHHLTSFMVEKGRLDALYFICVFVVVSVFLANVFRYFSNMILARVRVNVVQNLRNAAFQKIVRFDLGYFTSKRKGDMVSRITTDVQEVENSVVSTLKVFFKEPFLIIGYFIALFNMSVELTLYTLIIIPFAGTTISIISRRLRKRALRSQEALGRINSTLDEALGGMRIIKAFTAAPYMISKFANEVRNYAWNYFKLTTKGDLSSPLAEFIGVSVVAFILAIGGKMVLADESELNASEFIGFLIIYSQILPPAKAMSIAFSSISRGVASADRVFELIDSEQKINNRPNAVEVSDLREGIAFQQVSFAYEDRQVIQELNLNIKKGEIVALVGPSGGGKSTIADLIPRFYDPTSGQILLDGVDLKDFQINSLRGMMGMVTQESILFNDTIANNIAFGKPEATLAEIQEAAKIANAHEFIEKTEQGYDTVIGERGTKLSGGQRQRLSIARAVLKNPPILILDEATSALDSESEKLVQEAIYKLMQNRTCLVIAHRLSTIQNAHKIVVIEEGRIVQQGTHAELINQDGLYKKLSAMQGF